VAGARSGLRTTHIAGVFVPSTPQNDAHSAATTVFDIVHTAVDQMTQLGVGDSWGTCQPLESKIELLEKRGRQWTQIRLGSTKP
jgi:hypothetical protein